MEIESTTFGTITIDGKAHEHDVVIRLSGEIVKRKKKPSARPRRGRAVAFPQRAALSPISFRQ